MKTLNVHEKINIRSCISPMGSFQKYDDENQIKPMDFFIKNSEKCYLVYKRLSKQNLTLLKQNNFLAKLWFNRDVLLEK